MGIILRDIFGRRAPRNTEPRDARFMEDALRRWGDTVYRVALGQTGSPSDAEDVCQDVFVRLLRDRTTFTSEEHLKAWLIRVALNRCHDLARSRWSRRIPWDDQQAEEALHVSPTTTPAEESIRELIALLPEDQRATVTLYYAEGYPRRGGRPHPRMQRRGRPHAPLPHSRDAPPPTGRPSRRSTRPHVNR